MSDGGNLNFAVWILAVYAGAALLVLILGFVMIIHPK